MTGEKLIEALTLDDLEAVIYSCDTAPNDLTAAVDTLSEYL